MRSGSLAACSLHQGCRADVLQPRVSGAAGGSCKTGGQVGGKCGRNWTGTSNIALFDLVIFLEDCLYIDIHCCLSTEIIIGWHAHYVSIAVSMIFPCVG